MRKKTRNRATFAYRHDPISGFCVNVRERKWAFERFSLDWSDFTNGQSRKRYEGIGYIYNGAELGLFCVEFCKISRKLKCIVHNELKWGSVRKYSMQI